MIQRSNELPADRHCSRSRISRHLVVRSLIAVALVIAGLAAWIVSHRPLQPIATITTCEEWDPIVVDSSGRELLKVTSETSFTSLLGLTKYRLEAWSLPSGSTYKQIGSYYNTNETIFAEGRYTPISSVGDYLAIHDTDCVRFLSRATVHEEFRLPLPHNSRYVVTFSPDGSWMAGHVSGSDENEDFFATMNNSRPLACIAAKCQ